MAKLPDNTAPATASTFEELIVGDIPEAFDPFEDYNTGVKDENGSVHLSAEDIIAGRLPAKKAADTSKVVAHVDNDDAIDNALESFQLGKAKKAVNTNDANANDDDANADDDDDNDDADIDADDDADGKTNNDLIAYCNLMVSSGLWEKPETDFDGSEEQFQELVNINRQKEVESGIDSFLDEAFEKNPDGVVLGKRLIEHLASGGKIKDFVIDNKDADFDESSLDSDDDEVATQAAASFLRSYYESLGWDADHITKTIKSKTDKGTIIDEAKDSIEPYRKAVEKRSLTRIQQQQADKEKQIKLINTYRTGIASTVEKDTIIGIPIGPKKEDKVILKNYILEPVETENGRATQLQLDLQKVRTDPDWTVAMALTLKTFLAKKQGADKKQKSGTSLSEKVKAAMNGKARAAAGNGSDNLSTNRLKGDAVKKAWEI